MLSNGKIFTVTKVIRNGKIIVGYNLLDNNRKRYKVNAGELKGLLKEKKVVLRNYRLTSDGRIVKGKTYLSTGDKRWSELYQRWKKEQKPFPINMVESIPIPSDDFSKIDKIEKANYSLNEEEIGYKWLTYILDNWFYGELKYDCNYEEFKNVLDNYFNEFIEKLKRKGPEGV